MINIRIWLIFVIVATMIISTTDALPEILDGFNAKYDTTGTRLDTCDTCHSPEKENPYSLNPYGKDLKSHLNIETPLAFATIETLDSDGDRFSNIDEIHNLTFPGNKRDFAKKKKNNPFISVLEYFKIKFLSIIKKFE